MTRRVGKDGEMKGKLEVVGKGTEQGGELGGLSRRQVSQPTDCGGRYLSLIKRLHLRTGEVEQRLLKQWTQEAP